MPRLTKDSAAAKITAPKMTRIKKGRGTETDVESSKGETSLMEAKGNGQIYVEKGVTKNMGDYNSARVTVGITLPIEPTEAEIKAAKESLVIAHEIVDAEIENQVNQLHGDV